MNASIHPMPATAGIANMGAGTPANAKPLWAAIGVLGVCVLALGASLVHINKRPVEPVASAIVPGVSATTAAPPVTAPQSLAALAAMPMLPTESVPPKIDEKVVQSSVNKALPAPKTVAKMTPGQALAKPAAAKPVAVKPAAQPVAAGTTQVAGSTAPVTVAQAPAPVCGNCGTVEAVTPIVRDGKGGPVGVIAGGVVGGVLGNQVGKGDGRILGTVLGAAGGAWAGNAIEKKVRKETVYAVRVRMDDGNSRTMEQAAAPAVGAKVTVDGATLRSSDGAVYSPAPVAQKPAPVQQQAPREHS